MRQRLQESVSICFQYKRERDYKMEYTTINFSLFSKQSCFTSQMLVLGLFEVPFIWLFLAGSAIALWAWYEDQRNNGKFRKLGVPYAYNIPLIGNALAMLKFFRYGLKMLSEMNYKKYGRIYGSSFMGHPTLNISDPEMLKRIFVKDANSFTDRFNIIEVKPLKDGLLNLKGESWKRVRHLLTPTFSAAKLKAMLPLLQGTIATLTELIGEEADAGHEFVFTKKAGAFTMESIAKTMFAIESNAQKNPKDAFLYHGENMMKFSMRSPYMLLLMLFPSIKHVYNYFKISLLPKKHGDFFCEAVAHTVEERRKNGNAALYHDFLSLMMRAHEESDGKDSENALTTDEMLSQAFIFFLAGYETSANTFTLLIYFLAANAEKQEKVYKEIQEQLRGDERLNYENVKKLRYLGHCLEETGRMHSQASVINRVATENISIGDISFQKGDVVNIPAHCIHHDPEFWPEPEIFKPERFQEDPELVKSILYLPFGAGPRNCIGMRLAQLELKMAAAELLRHYRFDLGTGVPKNYADIKWAANPVKPADPFLFKVERRV